MTYEKLQVSFDSTEFYKSRLEKTPTSRRPTCGNVYRDEQDERDCDDKEMRIMLLLVSSFSYPIRQVFNAEFVVKNSRIIKKTHLPSNSTFQ